MSDHKGAAIIYPTLSGRTYEARHHAWHVRKAQCVTTAAHTFLSAICITATAIIRINQ